MTMIRTTCRIAGTLIAAAMLSACAGPAVPPSGLDISDDPVLQYYYQRMAKDPSIAHQTPAKVWAEHQETVKLTNLASGPCPKVGEPAMARAGQVAAKEPNPSHSWGIDMIYPKALGSYVDSFGEHSRGVLFMETGSKFTRRGNWTSVNGFGAAVEVTSAKIAYSGIAIESNDTANKTLWWRAIPANRPSIANDEQLWISGIPISGPVAATGGHVATFNSPADTDYTYTADVTIRLECAAVINQKSGEVVRRLY
jgi:hypothetical protein